MFRLNTISSAIPGAPFIQQLFKQYPKGLLCLALILRVGYPVSVTTGAWTPPAVTTLLPQIMNAAIGSLSMAYGDQAQHSVYNQVSGAEMRTVQRFVLGREVTNTLPTAPVAVSNVVWTFDLEIPFHVPGLDDGRKNLPGSSQMSTMVLTMLEGAAYTNTNGGTANRNVAAQCTCDVDLVTIPGKDQWSPILTLNKQTSTDLTTALQDGIQVGLWENTTNFAGTAIQFYQLASRTGAPQDQPLTGNIPPYIADDLFTYNWLLGGASGASNVDDTVTLLLAPQYGFKRAHLPAGKLVFSMPQLYVNPVNLRQLYWPVLGEQEAKEAATISANVADKNVLLYHDGSNTQMPDQHARSSAAIIATADDPQYMLQPGVIAKPNSAQAPNFTVPTHVLNALGGNVANAGKTSAATANSAGAQSLKNLAKLVPGLSPVSASAQTGVAAQAAIASKLKSNGVAIS